MDNVLLLNASYTPLRVISFKRAIVLLIQEKAEMVEATEHLVSSANDVFEVPSVIRLRYMVKIPFKSRIALNRRSVLARDRGICQYGCGRKASTIDHIHPRSRGGKHEWTNVAAACSPCNSLKGDRTLDELGWELLNEPFVPRGDIWLVAGVAQKEEWASYLSYA